jgi:hypothetical protein
VRPERITREDLRDLVVDAWFARVPAKLITEYQRRNGG